MMRCKEEIRRHNQFTVKCNDTFADALHDTDISSFGNEKELVMTLRDLYFIGWMDDLRSTVFQSGRWADDNEAVCRRTPFTVEKIVPRSGLEPGTAISESQRLTH